MDSQGTISSLITIRRKATDSGFDLKPAISVLEKYIDALKLLISQESFLNDQNKEWASQLQGELTNIRTDLQSCIGDKISFDYRDNWLLQKIYLDKLLRSFIEKINGESFNNVIKPNLKTD